MNSKWHSKACVWATTSRWRRVPEVRQLAASDCGAAALAIVLRFHGKYVPLAEVKRSIGIGRSGATATSILVAARAYGLKARGVKVEVETLDDLPMGSILHWEFRHYVVFERVNKSGVIVVDPATGRRLVPLVVFRKAFTGVALVLEPADDFQKQSPPRALIFGLFSSVRNTRKLLTQIVTTSLLVQILSLVLPLLTGILIDRVVPHKDYSLLFILAVGYCLVQIVVLLSSFVRSQLLVYLRTQLETRLTFRFIDHLVTLPYSFFQQRTYGDLMIRLGSNNTINDVLTSTVLSGIMDGGTAVVYLSLLLFTSIPLSLFVILLAACRLVLLFGVRRRQRLLLGQTIDNQAASQTDQIAMLSGMETLKAMGLEGEAARHWKRFLLESVDISIQRGRLNATFDLLMTFLAVVSPLVLMFFGCYQVLRGIWTLGTMIAFSAIAEGLLTPLNKLIASALQLQLLEVHLERLADVLETQSEEQQPYLLPMVPAALSGAIVLDDVSFKYSKNEPLVIQNISIAIPSGARIALVGPSGSGKSTLARLIAQLYDPSSGRIQFGVDTGSESELTKHTIRRQLGIVTQETKLFGGSIRRNIALSDEHMTMDRIIDAAKLACIHSDIVALPMGYDMPLIDHGLSLSGGQRQRLAIARALAGQPKILILDEATSHLDTVTESEVIRNLSRLGCTQIVIAHRLSTVRDADLILVLDSGRLVEHGHHSMLVNAGGPYGVYVGVQ